MMKKPTQFVDLPDDVMLHFLRVCMAEMRRTNALTSISHTNSRMHDLHKVLVDHCHISKSNIQRLASSPACSVCPNLTDDATADHLAANDDDEDDEKMHPAPSAWTLSELRLFTHTRTRSLTLHNVCDHVLAQVADLAPFRSPHNGMRSLTLTQRRRRRRRIPAPNEDPGAAPAANPQPRYDFPEDTSLLVDGADTLFANLPHLQSVYLTHPSSSMLRGVGSLHFLHVLHLHQLFEDQYAPLASFLSSCDAPLAELRVTRYRGYTANHHFNHDSDDSDSDDENNNEGAADEAADNLHVIRFEYTLAHSADSTASKPDQAKRITAALGAFFIESLRARSFDLIPGTSGRLALTEGKCDVCSARAGHFAMLRLAHPRRRTDPPLLAATRTGRVITPVQLARAAALRLPTAAQPVAAVYASRRRAVAVRPPSPFPLYEMGGVPLHASLADVLRSPDPAEYSGLASLRLESTFVRQEHDYDDEWNNSFYLTPARTLSAPADRAALLEKLAPLLGALTVLHVDPFYWWWSAGEYNDRSLVLDVLSRCPNLRVLNICSDAVRAFTTASRMHKLAAALPKSLTVLHMVGGVTYWNRDGENCILLVDVLPQVLRALTASPCISSLESLCWHLHRTFFRPPVDSQYVRRLRTAVASLDEFRTKCPHVDCEELVHLLSSKLPAD